MRTWLDVGVIDVDDRVRRSTCYLQLAVFGGFGLAASLSVGAASALSPISVLGSIMLVALFVLVWNTVSHPWLWNLFMPGVAVAYLLGVLQLQASAQALLTPVCLGVFWAAVFLPTSQVYVGTLCVSLSMLAQFQALGVSIATAIVVIGALCSNAVAAALFHNIVLSMRDARVQLESARHAAELQALTDPLTGLPNRRQAPGTMVLDKPAALMLIDIDHFKSINDRFGHAFGDAVLREVAHRACGIDRSLARRVDVLRWGGDEFVVMASGTTSLDVPILLGEAVRKAVAALPVVDGDVSLPVSVSIGATNWLPGERLETALAHADDALYAAKRAGRDRVEFAEPEVVDQATESPRITAPTPLRYRIGGHIAPDDTRDVSLKLAAERF